MNKSHQIESNVDTQKQLVVNRKDVTEGGRDESEMDKQCQMHGDGWKLNFWWFS